jgi:tRNA threonylcarbamoyladenosine biosynthesis protein TsaB
MKILAIETATDACSAALLINDQVDTVFELAPRKHTQLILTQIETVLANAEISIQALDAIAFGCGPGAFTGLRIAAGVTQGLALAADIPAIAVSTLAAMAQQAYQKHQAEKCYAALDARMDQVYWGKYQIDNGLAQLKNEEQVISPRDISEPDIDSFVGIGSGWLAYNELLTHVKAESNPVFQTIQPSAEQVAQLAVPQYQNNKFLFAEQIQPVYLRNKVAQTLIERGK